MKVVLGERIKALRERREWTQTELAKKIGISKSVMSRIESGKKPVDDLLLIKFVELFDTTSDYLLGLSLLNKKDNLNMENVDRAFVEEYMNLDEKSKTKFRKMIELIKDE